MKSANGNQFLGDLATGARRCVVDVLRHCNTFRAAEYQLCRFDAEGRATRDRVGRALQTLGNFETHNQDTPRTAEQRKRNLARVSKLYVDKLTQFVAKANQAPTHHGVTLHHLKQISNAALGEHSSSDTALRYIRRASLKLHPDKTQDLAGWSQPNVLYFKELGANYRYEHARMGARGLFALHQALKELHSNPHYRRALSSPIARQGGSLTVPHLARDLILVAAALVVVALKKPGTAFASELFISGAYGSLAVIHTIQCIQLWTTQRQHNQCRDVILYNNQGVSQ